jgi:3-oxoacyl-[acyl-carrier protein] reductase
MMLNGAMDLPRTALVTGASRGIGAGIVRRLHAEGYQVGLLGRDRTLLDAIAGELSGGTAVATADVVEQDEVADAVEQVVAQIGPIGLLVNNAGVIEHDEVGLAEADLDDVWRVLTVNVRGPLVVSRTVLPQMIERGGGRIVNVTSGSAYSSGTAYTGYGMSKAALSRMSWALHREYASAGIRVLDLAPGVVVTQMTQGMPLHAGRTAWTSLDEVTDLVVGFGDGLLDDLSGRFVRAGADTVDSLRAAVASIAASDARRLRVPRYGEADPLI